MSLQYNHPGSLELEKSKEEANEDVWAGRNIRYRVTFPLLYPLPVVTELKYNGQLICSGRAEVPGVGEQVSTIQLHHTIKTTQPGYQVVTQPSYNGNNYQGGTFQWLQQPQTPAPSQVSGGSKPALTVYFEDGTSYTTNQGGQTASNLPVEITQLLQTNNAPKPVPPNSGASNYWVTEPTAKPEYASSTTTTTTQVYLVPSTPAAVAPPAIDEDLSFHIDIGDQVSCGSPVLPSNNLAVGGVATKKGEWPWIVAIYMQKIKASSLQLDYHCSGTLVSKDVVITAGHCVRTQKGEVMSLTELQVHIGQNNLADLTESGIIIQKPRQIEPHPDYKIWDVSSTSSDADIAIVRLREKVTFTQFIRPACLWESSKDVKEIVNKKGVMVGWGRDGTGEVSNLPNKVVLAPVTNDVCIKSNDVFEYIVSARTFCAGNRDGTGPCNGDSGAGWLLKRDDGKWYLRGVISSSLPDPDRNNLCDLKNYVVMADTARFRNWINKFL